MGRAPGGGSGAQLYRVAENNDTYVVKLKGSQQGIRVLVNEYVAGRIGEIMGVPFGQHVLIEIPDSLLPPHGEPNLPQSLPGVQFGTTYFENAQSDLTALRQAQNFNQFPSVVVFDTFIALGNGRQHLVYPGPHSQNGARDTGAIFDQGYAFGATPNWSSASLAANQNCSALDTLNLKTNFPTIAAYEPYIQMVEGLGEAQLQAIIVEIPLAEWQVTPDEANALVAWLDHRKGLVRTAIQGHL
jgi:hypothetical protein